MKKNTIIGIGVGIPVVIFMVSIGGGGHTDLDFEREYGQDNVQESNSDGYFTEELKLRNEKINGNFLILKQDYLDDRLDGEQYRQELLELRESELKLYDDVRNHEFGQSELQDYNYWYRGVLKFPSSLQQELDHLVE